MAQVSELDDDSYQAFVGEIWPHKGIDLGNILIQRMGFSEAIDCFLLEIIKGKNGHVYVKCKEQQENKVYRLDGRHRWLLNEN